MDGNTPQSPASANSTSAGTTLATCSLILFIAGIALSFIPAIGIFIAIPFFVTALILSILAIVKGATVFGIIMLCATVLLSGPTACFASCVGNTVAVAVTGASASEQQEKMSKPVRMPSNIQPDDTIAADGKPLGEQTTHPVQKSLQPGDSTEIDEPGNAPE